MLEKDIVSLHNVLASRFLLRNLCFPLYFSFLVLITRRKLSVISKDDLMWNTLVFVLLVYGPFQPYNSSSESVGYSIPIRAPWSQGKFINGSGFFASKLGGFKTELVVPCQGESKLQRGPQKLPLSPSPSFSPSHILGASGLWIKEGQTRPAEHKGMRYVRFLSACFFEPILACCLKLLPDTERLKSGTENLGHRKLET